MLLPAFRTVSVLLLLLAGLGRSGAAAEYFAAPDAAANGDGTQQNPWRLATALTNSAIRPGDTLWLRGGTYKGTFISRLMGSATAPILVRNYRNERAIIDGNLAGTNTQNTIVFDIPAGGYVWFWGFEILNSDPQRVISVTGSNPPNRRGNAIDVRAPGVKLINLIIHDTGQGIGAWSQATDFEGYGNIIYNNGWTAPDRGHGHGLYTQNTTGTKLFKDNVIMHQFGNTVSMFGSSAAFLRNFVFEGNVLFGSRILFGGDSPLENIAFRNNYTYDKEVEFGFDTLPGNHGISITGNYLPAGVTFKWMDDFSLTDNVLLQIIKNGSARTIGLTLPNGGNTAKYVIDRNTYYQSNFLGLDFWMPGQLFTFQTWQDAGFERSGTYTRTSGPAFRPPDNKIFLRKNDYDPNRAMAIVYNWTGADSVDVDVSSFLAPGEPYEIRNTQDYVNDVITGTASGSSIRIPMTGRGVAKPSGYDTLIGGTFPEFGVFIINKTSTASQTPRLTAGGVTNGASNTAGAVSPGLISVIYGQGFGPIGTRVLFDGKAAPILYNRVNQIGVVVPYSVAGQASTVITIEQNGIASAPVTVPVADAIPALFTADSSGNGQAAALNEDGSFNGPNNPASPGSYIVLYATGEGQTSPAGEDGKIAGTNPPKPVLPVEVRIGGQTVTPDYAGGTPGQLGGLLQVNARIPDGLTPGSVPIVLVIGSRESSKPVTIAIK